MFSCMHVDLCRHAMEDLSQCYSCRQTDLYCMSVVQVQLCIRAGVAAAFGEGIARGVHSSYSSNHQRP